MLVATEIVSSAPTLPMPMFCSPPAASDLPSREKATADTVNDDAVGSVWMRLPLPGFQISRTPAGLCARSGPVPPTASDLPLCAQATALTPQMAAVFSGPQEGQ